MSRGAVIDVQTDRGEREGLLPQTLREDLATTSGNSWARGPRES